MSSVFYMTFSKEQSLIYEIPSGGWIEIEANSVAHAHEIATRKFPATRRLPFGGYAGLYSEDEMIDKLTAGYFKTGKLGEANDTHLTWTFIGGGQAA